MPSRHDGQPDRDRRAHPRPATRSSATPARTASSFEAGALAALWGVQARTVAGERGAPRSAPRSRRRSGPARRTTRARASSRSRTRTTAAAARSARSSAFARGRRARARGAGSHLHLDGARLLNAARRDRARAGGVRARRRRRVSVCFSKGLGAPGGLGAGGPARRSSRRRAGCASGSAAACARPASSPRRALHALEHHVRAPRRGPRATRARLADGLSPLGPALAPFPVETNLVFVAFAGRSAAELSRAPRARRRAREPGGLAPDLAPLRHPPRRVARRHGGGGAPGGGGGRRIAHIGASRARAGWGRGPEGAC